MTRPARAATDAWLVAAILLVALNLRGAIAAVSPVLPQIREDLSLTAASAGLLTTLPVLCFAALAPAAAWLARRAGLENAVLLGCLAIAAGTVLRTLGDTWVLLAGTLMVGVAITVGNVAVPVVLKRDFPRRAGTVTGLYTAALAGGAAATAGLTAPVATAGGWRLGLAVWALLAVAAAVVWWVVSRARRDARAETGGPDRPDEDRPGEHAGDRAPRSMWREPVAWAVALVLGCQSLAYYAATAWLPTLLIDEVGASPSTAGGGMALFQVLGIGGTLLVPLLAGRRASQSWIGGSVALGWAVMFAGLLLWPSAWVVWTVVGGIAQGVGIAFAFTVMVLRAHDTAAARRLSGMSQLVGYSLGASGPVVVGALVEATGAWNVPLVLLLAVAGCHGAAALVAGRNTTVGAIPTGRAAAH